jgi:hypothetical protein
MCEIIVYPQQNKIRKWKKKNYLFLLKNVYICISFWSYCTKYNLIFLFSFVDFFTKNLFSIIFTFQINYYTLL